MILDFIKDHGDCVQYTKTKEPGSFLTHTVSIQINELVLSASLRENIYIDFNNPIIHAVLPCAIGYSLSCTKDFCSDHECILNQEPIVQEEDIRNKRKSKFPLRVYNTMMDYYIKNQKSNHVK